MSRGLELKAPLHWAGAGTKEGSQEAAPALRGHLSSETAPPLRERFVPPHGAPPPNTLTSGPSGGAATP
jgi:hypothetical protein